MTERHETAYGIFEWDSDKNIANIRKHKISFVEAAEVFLDPYMIFQHDAAHSLVENRYKIIGSIRQFRLVAVIVTDRSGIVRLISARKATKDEVREYEQAIPD